MRSEGCWPPQRLNIRRVCRALDKSPPSKKKRRKKSSLLAPSVKSMSRFVANCCPGGHHSHNPVRRSPTRSKVFRLLHYSPFYPIELMFSPASYSPFQVIGIPDGSSIMESLEREPTKLKELGFHLWRHAFGRQKTIEFDNFRILLTSRSRWCLCRVGSPAKLGRTVWYDEITRSSISDEKDAWAREPSRPRKHSHPLSAWVHTLVIFRTMRLNIK